MHRPRNPWRGVVFGLCALLAWAPASALDVGGYVAGELRWFPQSPRLETQLEDLQASAVLAPEFRHGTRDRRWTFIPYARLDGRDAERSHFDVRELHYRRASRDWDFVVGINRVFWGVTESRHLVDVINQTDLVEDIDAEDKLGQPMINLTTLRDWGTLGLYVLPGFRERTFPGEDGRLRAPWVVDTDAARFESGAAHRHVDAALRYSHYFGDWDLGVHYFYGTGREPRLMPDPARGRLVPHYDLIHQVGVDVQYTREAWLWKLEGLAREGQGKTFGALVAGFEYTFYQVGNSDSDVGVLLEYLYDGRNDHAPATLFEDDVFIGTRLALNDIDDTQLLAGVIVDVSDGEQLWTLEAERRLSDHWSAELIARVFTGAAQRSPAYAFDADDYVQLQLRYYF